MESNKMSQIEKLIGNYLQFKNPEKKGCYSCKWSEIYTESKYGTCNVPLPKAISHLPSNGEPRASSQCNLFMTNRPFLDCPTWAQEEGKEDKNGTI